MGKLFAFLIYSFIYLCGLGSVIGHYLGVSPFACFSYETQEVFINPFADWIILYRNFLYDNWAINSTQNLVIFFVFLFYYPVWIGLWFLVRRVRWGQLMTRPFRALFHAKAPVVVSKDLPQKHVMGRPKALPQGRGFGASLLSQMAENTSGTPAGNNSVATTENVVRIAKPQVADTVSDELKEEVRSLGLQYGYDLFERVRLDDYTVPLVLATDTQALLLSFMTEKREWIADEEVGEDGGEPTWFSADGLVPSPFYQMCQAAIVLQEKEPTSQVIPVVVLCDGTILNVETMLPIWTEKGGFVVSWQNGTGNGLQLLPEFLATQKEKNSLI